MHQSHTNLFCTEFLFTSATMCESRWVGKAVVYLCSIFVNQTRTDLTGSIYLWFYSPLLGLGPIFSFLTFHTIGRTPWTGDQPVARPLHTQSKAPIQNKNTNIHLSTGIRTQDPSVRTGEVSSWFRPRGHRDRLTRYDLVSMFANEVYNSIMKPRNEVPWVVGSSRLHLLCLLSLFPSRPLCPTSASAQRFRH
jgi:hypothetical protein